MSIEEWLDPELLKGFLLEPPSSDQDLVKSLQQLKTNFTSSREQIAQYRESAKLVSAYTWFYLTTNIPKFSFVLDQLSDEIKEEFFQCDFIDIGTGPGTYILAHHRYQKGFEGKYFGIDASDIMLSQAQKVLEGFQVPRDRFHLSSSLNSIKSEQAVLFFGNSINEIASHQLLELVKLVYPKFVMFIEPGTKESFLKIMEFRSDLFKRNFQCHFPCPGLTTKCPMKIETKMGNQDWCHQVLKYTHHADIQRMAQIAQFNRNVMPLISHIYSNQDFIKNLESNVENKNSSSEKIEGFLIQKVNESKHSFHWRVCLDHQNYRGIYHIEFFKKKLEKSFAKGLKKLSTGITLEFSVEKVLEEKKLRVTDLCLK